jgi:hypothetical protein
VNRSTKARTSLYMKISNNFMGVREFLPYHFLLLSRSDNCIYIFLNVHRFKHWSFQNQNFSFVHIWCSQELWYGCGTYISLCVLNASKTIFVMPKNLETCWENAEFRRLQQWVAKILSSIHLPYCWWIM